MVAPQVQHYQTTPSHSSPMDSVNSPGLAIERPSLARQDTDAFLSYYHTPIADVGNNAPTTPVIVDAKDQPSIKPTSPSLHSRIRSLSAESVSSASDYSSEYSDHDEEPPSPPAQFRRRASNPSKGSSDRRRLAVVEMQSVNEALSNKPAEDNVGDGAHSHHKALSSGSIKSRRGLEDRLRGLALVAPPDALLSSYAPSKAPMTAPIESDHVIAPSLAAHHRSASEAVALGKSLSTHSKASTETSVSRSNGTDTTMLQPINTKLQHPNASSASSKSSSPGVSSDAYYASSLATTPIRKLFTSTSILTPEIGQSKMIHEPVAAPVVIRLNSDTVRKPNQLPGAGSPATSSSVSTPSIVINASPGGASPAVDYLHYQPGLDSTAGPLPNPPSLKSFYPKSASPSGRSPPPPRPPRMSSPPPTRRAKDMDAVRQALQLPPSVTAKLGQTPSPSTSSRDNPLEDPVIVNNIDKVEKLDDSPKVPPAHVREAAFSPSVFLNRPSRAAITTPAERDASPDKAHLDPIKDSENEVLTDGGEVTEDTAMSDREEPRSRFSVSPSSIRPPSPELVTILTRQGSWADYNSRSGNDANITSPPLPVITPSMMEMTPSPPPKSVQLPLDHAVDLKRNSTLPRRPSYGTDMSDTWGERSPSPPSLSPPPVAQQRPRRPKIVERVPAAMFFADVLSHKSALERGAAYAHKINELSMYDCGLTDWLMDVRDRGTGTQRSAKPSLFSSSPSSPSTRTFQPHGRDTSRSSIMSEVTFPRRPDASTATDLSLSRAISNDYSPSTAPPPLPYPSLIQPQRSQSSKSSTGTSPSSSLRTPMPPSAHKAAAFFASLGRKSSSKKDSSSKPTLSGYSSSSGTSSSAPTTPKFLTKSPPPPKPSPRVINIQNSPVVPGGPRAVPNRQHRSQTIMPVISAPFGATINGTEVPVSNRPSMYKKSSSDRASAPVNNDVQQQLRHNPEFARQVDKLADLLPQADKAVLAGYLRRSGQDILAIGQYLEDEKNGTLKV